jgi:hypothetical protein
MRRASFTLIVIALFLIARPRAFGQHVLDSTNFHIEWSDGDPANPEEIDVLQWKGQNWTNSWNPGGCGGNSDFYSGNAWAPPDPAAGGIVLVGAGSQGTWTEGVDGLSAVIKSISRGCSSSGQVHVRTKYKLYNAGSARDTIRPQCMQDHIWLKRSFAFGAKAFTYDFRPYMPRLYPRSQFRQVLHPDVTHSVLVTEDANLCEYGCQVSDWDGTWFAIHDPDNFRGVIVHREASTFAVNLWVDLDGGGSQTNASSVLALQPDGGFTGSVTEVEKLCFYDTTNWSQKKQERLELPLGCRVPPK